MAKTYQLKPADDNEEAIAKQLGYRYNKWMRYEKVRQFYTQSFSCISERGGKMNNRLASMVEVFLADIKQTAELMGYQINLKE